MKDSRLVNPQNISHGVNLGWRRFRSPSFFWHFSQLVYQRPYEGEKDSSLRRPRQLWWWWNIASDLGGKLFDVVKRTWVCISTKTWSNTKGSKFQDFSGVVLKVWNESRRISSGVWYAYVRSMRNRGGSHRLVSDQPAKPYDVSLSQWKTSKINPL